MTAAFQAGHVGSIPVTRFTVKALVKGSFLDATKPLSDVRRARAITRAISLVRPAKPPEPQLSVGVEP